MIWSSVRFKLALQDGVLAPEVFHLQPQKSDVNWFKNIIRCVFSNCVCMIIKYFFVLDLFQVAWLGMEHT